MGGVPIMAEYLIFVALFLVVTIGGGAVNTAIRKPFADEIGHQIDRIPERVFFAALRFFPEDERERRFDQWAEDYQELSDAYEKRTLVRVWKCTGFSLNLLAHSGFIGRRKPSIRLRKWRRVKPDIITLDDGRRLQVHGRIGGIVLSIQPSRDGGEVKYLVGGEEFATQDDALKYAANMAYQEFKQAEE